MSSIVSSLAAERIGNGVLIGATQLTAHRTIGFVGLYAA
jgi:hypothetical protein